MSLELFGESSERDVRISTAVTISVVVENDLQLVFYNIAHARLQIKALFLKLGWAAVSNPADV